MYVFGEIVVDEVNPIDESPSKPRKLTAEMVVGDSKSAANHRFSLLPKNFLNTPTQIQATRSSDTRLPVVPVGTVKSRPPLNRADVQNRSAG